MIWFDECQISIVSVHSIKQNLQRIINVAKREREKNQYEEIFKKRNRNFIEDAHKQI